VNAVDLNIVLRSGIRHRRSNLCGMEYKMKRTSEPPHQSLFRFN
jgi:hypothetical protein